MGMSDEMIPDDIRLGLGGARWNAPSGVGLNGVGE